uniref:AAA+ ATPase At3g28540-like C-terminal domain-containing protein n=1 Tax=Cucumis melo TaxID=3656 RepID=A0A9I9CSK3_CUCME
MDINLTYCTSKAFKVFGDPLYEEIEGLIHDANVTPVELAEELMKVDDVEMVMEGLVKLVKVVKREEQIDGNERPEEEEEEEEEKTTGRKSGGGIVKYRGRRWNCKEDLELETEVVGGSQLNNYDRRK